MAFYIPVDWPGWLLIHGRLAVDRAGNASPAGGRRVQNPKLAIAHQGCGETKLEGQETKKKQR